MKKELKLFILGFVVLCFAILLMNTQVSAAVTLDENNPVLELTGDIEGPIIVESGDVVIRGNGTVTSPTYTGPNAEKEFPEESCTILVKGGNLTIEGGTFISDTGCSKTVYAALYVKENGIVTVNGGTFIGKGTDMAVRVCDEKTTVEGGATLTVNAGTFKSEWVTGLADCGGTLNINGGTWSSTSVWDGQSDVLNKWAMDSGKQGVISVTGGSFVNFDLTKVYTSVGTDDTEITDGTSSVIAEGYEYEYDEETNTYTVACPHGTLTPVDEVAATLTSVGTKAHFDCETCGKLFADAEATEETTADSLVIPKLVEDDKKDEKEEKDETPKMGVESTALTVFAVVAVISLAGLVVVKKDRK